MKGSVERLAVLLAASGLSERDITDALRASKNLDEKEFIERVVFLRQFLFSGLDVNDVSSSGQRIAAGNKDQIRAVERATQLLQTEARLNPTRAADLLCKSLAEDNFDLENIPKFRTKNGLRNWLIKLPLQPSELLHHATKIRNRLVHARSAPWPLRERGT
jgi:hypothetical protein